MAKRRKATRRKPTRGNSSTRSTSSAAGKKRPRSMVRKVDPRGVFEIMLERDVGLSPRPVFLYRRLNGYEWEQFLDLQERFDGVEEDLKSGGISAREALSLAWETLKIGLCGWRNQRDPATGDEIEWDPEDPDRIKLVINPVEAQELIVRVQECGLMETAEKKA